MLWYRSTPCTTQSQWLDALLLGAFVYFSKAGSVLRINALSLKPSTARLRLERPTEGFSASFSELESQSRVQSVTLSHLLETGLQRMAWAMPREAPGGAPLSEESGVDWPSGHGRYEQRVLAEGGNGNSTQIVFFRVVPGGGSAGAIGDVFKASSEHLGAIGGFRFLPRSRRCKPQRGRQRLSSRSSRPR